jgi:hypothetical protein
MLFGVCTLIESNQTQLGELTFGPCFVIWMVDIFKVSLCVLWFMIGFYPDMLSLNSTTTDLHNMGMLWGLLSGRRTSFKEMIIFQLIDHLSIEGFATTRLLPLPPYMCVFPLWKPSLLWMLSMFCCWCYFDPWQVTAVYGYNIDGTRLEKDNQGTFCICTNLIPCAIL